MPLIPELASNLPGGMTAGFWTVQMLVNGYAGLKFAKWWQKH